MADNATAGGSHLLQAARCSAITGLVQIGNLLSQALGKTYCMVWQRFRYFFLAGEGGGVAFF